MEVIKSHVELAKYLHGKRVLHLNSLGKDSLVTLEWLHQAGIETVSIYFSMLAQHPDDLKYWTYLQYKYPKVLFVWSFNTQELNRFRFGVYQSPVEILTEYNKWEHYSFDFGLMMEEMRKKWDCDYTVHGESKYESVTRASSFYKRGLLQGTKAYPLGLWTKKQVFAVLKNLKIHPSYHSSKGTFDFPSYYKMRAAFLRNPDYEKTMFKFYPLLKLDKYRYEVMLKGKHD